MQTTIAMKKSFDIAAAAVVVVVSAAAAAAATWIKQMKFDRRFW